MSLLQADPSRTSIIRQSFERDFERRINKLTQAVRTLLKSKAFGQITVNIFCHTGKGGGIDPTCSPKKLNLDFSHETGFAGKVQTVKIGKASVVYQTQADGKVQLSSIRVPIKSRGTGEGRKALDRFLTEADQKGLTVELLASPLDKKTKLDKLVNFYESVGFKVTERGNAAGEPKMVREPKLTGNAFCPTGEGGGIDNSCSPKKKNWTSVASRIKGLVWNAFGIVSEVKFHYDDSGKVYGEHGETAWVVNPDLGDRPHKGLNFTPAPDVTETSHLITHELIHKVYSTDADLGEEIANRLSKIKASNGSAVSIYGAFAGKFENAIELGAVYVHSPEQLRSYSKEMYALADEWASRVQQIAINSRWAFEESQSKVDSFEQWLKAKLSEVLNEKDIHSGTDWWQIYIERAYKFGAARAFDQIHKKKAIPTEGMLGAKQFFMGSLPKERLKLLVARTYKGIEGLTESMRNQLTQELTDGLLQGLSYNEVGKRINNRLGIGLNRAKTIARTEIVRAQAEGQLAALKALGVKQLGVEVEFHTAKTPCPKCKKYRGRILTVEEAEGLIPLHPNCKCAFTPFVNPIPSPQKTARKKALEASILKVGKKK